MPSLPPADATFSLLSRPHPPYPLPSGKGETISLFCRGLRPRHPGIRPFTALKATATAVPGGGLAFLVAGSPLPPRFPAGCLPSLSPADAAFSLFVCPHPPNPLPSGKGETISLFCRGLRPRHPGIRPLTALTDTATMVPGGGLAFLVAGSPLPPRFPAGCLPSLSPADAAFSLFVCPHPPNPLPSGKGETISLFCRGLRPRHPGIRPLTALTDTATMVPGGGRAVFVACLSCL